ncbi:MAG: MATE family efflux transporter [Caldithrix sp.]|nr:MATE family efflux transporter [Caldithrix sp.]
MYTYRRHLTETFKLALPVSIGQLSHIMMGVEDSLMVGRVGADALAASSLVNGLVFLVVVFGLGMSLAITPLVAIARGRENYYECGIILRQALLVNMVVAVLLLLIVYFFAGTIGYLNQPKLVTIKAISYARIISFSIIPFILFQSYRQFIEGLSFTRPAMYITIAANIVNILGNWIFIYGNCGVPAYGLDGAGYSTFISRSFMAITIMIYVLSAGRYKQFDPTFRFRNINWNIIRKVLSLGLPSGLQHFFEVGAFSFSAVMIGWLGSNALAAHQVALSLASISFMIILGVSAAGTIRVGNAYGRQNQNEVRQSGFLALVFAAAVMAVFAIIFILFRYQLPSLFIEDQQVISTAATILIVAAFFQISDGSQAVGLGILRGITDVKIPMIITFIAYWVVALPVGYILGFKAGQGVTGVWLGLLAGLTTAAILLNIRFHFMTKSI